MKGMLANLHVKAPPDLVGSLPAQLLTPIRIAQ